MDVRFGGEIVFGHEPFEVLAISLHPLRATVFVAACSAGGCELIEADCVHGDILARTPLSRRVRHLRHQVVKADEGRATDGTMLILAYEDGDVEVWDAHRQVLQDRLLPSKKDEGKAVTALSSSAVGTVAIVYYTRGGSVVERSEACTGKTLRLDLKSGRITSMSSSVQAQTGFIALGFADGDVKLIDGNTLTIERSLSASSAMALKGPPATALRSPVTSVSFHPRTPQRLAATLQRGSVVVWDTRREALEESSTVRSHTEPLVHGEFHPFLPLYVAISKDGNLSCWPIPSSGPLKLDDTSDRPKSVSLTAVESTSALARGLHSDMPLGLLTSCHYIRFHPLYNVFCVHTRRRSRRTNSSMAVNRIALFHLEQPHHPAATFAICSSQTPQCMLAQHGEEGAAWVEDSVLVMQGRTLAAFSISEGNMHDVLQVPTDLYGLYHRAVHLSWIPLCGLAFLVLSPLSGDGSGTLPASLDEVVVAAVVVGNGGRREGEVACVMPCRDAVVVLHSSSYRSIADPANTDYRHNATREDGNPWTPSLLLLSTDGTSMRWCKITKEPSEQNGAEKEGVQADCTEWDQCGVSVENLRKLSSIGTPQAAAIEASIQLPQGVVLSRIWARPLPARLPSSVWDKGAVGSQAHGETREDIAAVAGWDVMMHRVVCVSVYRHRNNASCQTVLQLEVGEALFQVSWKRIGGTDHVAVLTSERLVVVKCAGSIGTDAVVRMRVVAELFERGLESVLWVGDALCFSSSSCIRVLYLATDGGRRRNEREILCTLDTYGGVLAAVLPDRVVYVAQECGMPIVVSRPVGLMPLMLRAAIDLSAGRSDRGRASVSAAAAQILEKYDVRRSSLQLLDALCEAGEEQLAWALAHRMTWLPLNHLLGLAFRCAKYRYCLGLLDALTKCEAGSLRALGQNYREVGQACSLRGALATAAQAFMRAGLCGMEDCFWILYRLLHEHDDDKGIAALLSIATKCDLSDLRVKCAARLRVDISHDLLPNGAVRAGIGIGGATGGWWERWGKQLPWVALLGSASAPRGSQQGASEATSSWHSLNDAEQNSARRDDIFEEGGSFVPLESVRFSQEAARAKVWVRSGDAGHIEKDLSEIDLNVNSNWQGLHVKSNVSQPSHECVGALGEESRNEADAVNQRTRSGTHPQGRAGDEDKITSSKDSREHVVETVEDPRDQSLKVDEEGYSIRPPDALRAGGANTNPFLADPAWSSSDGEPGQDEEDVVKPVIRVTIRAADEVSEEDTKDALLDIMKQMTVPAPTDDAEVVVGSDVPVLDIGFGTSSSLFSGKSRRRTMAGPPPSTVSQVSLDAKHGAKIAEQPAVEQERKRVDSWLLPEAPRAEQQAEPKGAQNLANLFDEDPFGMPVTATPGGGLEFDSDAFVSDPFAISTPADAGVDAGFDLSAALDPGLDPFKSVVPADLDADPLATAAITDIEEQSAGEVAGTMFEQGDPFEIDPFSPPGAGDDVPSESPPLSGAGAGGETFSVLEEEGSPVFNAEPFLVTAEEGREQGGVDCPSGAVVSGQGEGGRERNETSSSQEDNVSFVEHDSFEVHLDNVGDVSSWAAEAAAVSSDDMDDDMSRTSPTMIELEHKDERRDPVHEHVSETSASPRAPSRRSPSDTPAPSETEKTEALEEAKDPGATCDAQTEQVALGSDAHGSQAAAKGQSRLEDIEAVSVVGDGAGEQQRPDQTAQDMAQDTAPDVEQNVDLDAPGDVGRLFGGGDGGVTSVGSDPAILDPFAASTVANSGFETDPFATQTFSVGDGWDPFSLNPPRCTPSEAEAGGEGAQVNSRTATLAAPDGCESQLTFVHHEQCEDTEATRGVQKEQAEDAEGAEKEDGGIATRGRQSHLNRVQADLSLLQAEEQRERDQARGADFAAISPGKALRRQLSEASHLREEAAATEETGSSGASTEDMKGDGHLKRGATVARDGTAEVGCEGGGPVQGQGDVGGWVSFASESGFAEDDGNSEFG